MIKYTRIPTNNFGKEGFRYTKNGLMTKESRVPHEVMEKFMYTPSVEYDDQPDKERCIACDAFKSRTRMLNLEEVNLCEYHYQNMNLGSIAAQVRINKEEQERKIQDGIRTQESKRRLKKSHQSRTSKVQTRG